MSDFLRAMTRVERVIASTNQSNQRQAKLAVALDKTYRGITRTVLGQSAAHARSEASLKRQASTAAQLARSQREAATAQVRASRATSRSSAGGGGGGRGIGSLFGGIGGGLPGLAVNVVTKPFRIAGDVLQKGVGTAVRVAKTGLIAAALAGGAAFASSIQAAVKTEPLRASFESIVDSRGLGQQAEVLERLRAATRGTISDQQIFLQTNRALALGAAENVGQLELLITAGRRLGQAMGRTATEGFEDLALGIGRQSRLILDNLGLIVKVESANRAYAASVGKTVASLTDQERKLAFQQAAFDAIRVKLKQLGDEQSFASLGIDRLGASFTNLRSRIGKDALPAVADLSNAWADFLDQIEPGAIQSALSGSVAAVGRGGAAILDAIFGTQSDVRKRLSVLGDDLSSAIRSPSREAFTVLFNEGKQAFNNLKIVAINIWTEFRIAAAKAFDVIGRVFDASPIGQLIRAGRAIFGSEIGQALIKATPGAKLLGVLLEKVNENIGLGVEAEKQLRDNVQATTVALKAQNAELAKGAEAARVRRDLAKEITRLGHSSARPIERGDGGIGGATRSSFEGLFLDGGVTGGSSARGSGAAPSALSKVFREEVRQRKAMAARLQKLIAPEIRLRERELAALKKSVSARAEEQKSLLRLKTDLQRSRAGLEPILDVGPALAEAAKSVRQTASALKETQEAIEKAKADLPKAIAELTSTFNRARNQAIRDFQDAQSRRGNSFLQGEPFEGASTRARSVLRRAQRDRRRENAAVLNRAFESRGFGGGPSIGGFGAQGVERVRFPQVPGIGIFGARDNPLDRGVPSRDLFDALEKVRNPDGSRGELTTELFNRIAELVEEAVSERDELHAGLERLEEAEKKAKDKRREADKEALAVLDRLSVLADENAAEDEEQTREIRKIKDSLESLRRGVKKKSRGP